MELIRLLIAQIELTPKGGASMRFCTATSRRILSLGSTGQEVEQQNALRAFGAGGLCVCLVAGT